MKLSNERNVLLEKEDGSVSFKFPILKTPEYPHPTLVDNILFILKEIKKSE